jgi:hypothetical protein
VNSLPKSSASKIGRISISVPPSNGAFFNHATASSMFLTFHSQKPAMSSLVSANGPSITVRWFPENRTRLPLELGCSPRRPASPGLHEFFVVLAHVAQELLARHLAGFRFLARLHDHQNPHDGLLSFLYIVVERRPEIDIVMIRLNHSPADYNWPHNGQEIRPLQPGSCAGRVAAGSEEGTSWGTPALKIDGQMFACIPINKSAEPARWRFGSISRNAMSCWRPTPRRTNVKEHYVNYPCVLVRLARMHDDACAICCAWGMSSFARRKKRAETIRRSDDGQWCPRIPVPRHRGVWSVRRRGRDGAARTRRPLHIEKVKDNLFVITGGRGTGSSSSTVSGNTTVFIAASGVVLVDTKLPGLARAFSNRSDR